MERASGLGILAQQWQNFADRRGDLDARMRESLASLGADDLQDARVWADLMLGSEASIDEESRKWLFRFLDRLRRRPFLDGLRPELVADWTALAVRVIDRANYTFHELIKSREATEPGLVAIRVLGDDACEVRVGELGRRCRTIARGIISLIGDDAEAKVAILAENSLESAICDLACLTSGIVNIRIPANSVASQVEYMLRHSGAKIAIVSNEEQLAKVQSSQSLPDLRHIVVISRASAEMSGLMSLEQMVAGGSDLDDEALDLRTKRLRSGDLATIMYTSGTTGAPKGIQFSQLNVVTKRLCRSFAVPGLGEGDIFLSYLPLYHTFGRYFELLGSIYWGATYVFARDPSQATLLEDFAHVKPTVFISVPKKWMELHEQARIGLGDDNAQAIGRGISQLTGGSLRFGISAAGYLDPLVFRTVREAGINLCSGYGMTEATGGITMTPPDDYRDGSIGKPLPGIELRLAEDGELLMRGPYVMIGYYKPEDGDCGISPEGWFSSGDIMIVDDGHYRIVDRKKEIYKNKKGQTIAPQRVENLFRDFEAVSQAFLVGDHKDYNTLLLWPNYSEPALHGKSEELVRGILGSLVASSNRFLAPYERIVSFRILPRALSEEHLELTPKGTYKRQVVEEHWRELIEPMYQVRDFVVALGAMRLRIPNWLIREIGVLRQNIRAYDGYLEASGRKLTIGSSEDGWIQLGDYEYHTKEPTIDLGILLSKPSLWLGNDGLRRFIGEEAFLSLLSRRRDLFHNLELRTGNAQEPDHDRVLALSPQVDLRETTNSSLHAAALLMRSSGNPALASVAHLERGLHYSTAALGQLCRILLRRASDLRNEEVRRKAFHVLLTTETEAQVVETVRKFFDTASDEPFLVNEDYLQICEKGMSEGQVNSLLSALSIRAEMSSELVKERRILIGVMRLLTSYAIAHPIWYSKTRYRLARLGLHEDPETAARASEELARLQLGFRAWLGANLRLAVDSETLREYTWREVLVFEDDVNERHKDWLLRCIIETCLVRESVFLFGRGVLLTLADVGPSGIRVSHLGTRLGKSVYRLNIQTKARGNFDLAVNLADGLSLGDLRDEIHWLMASGAPPPLVEEFGGYFAEFGVFSEEFIPGETVQAQIDRLARHGMAERLRALWPYLVWVSLMVHVDFWDRTGRKLGLAEPSPANVIAPSHDYQIGARLVSISKRSPCESVWEVLTRFDQHFIKPIQEIYGREEFGVSGVILMSAVIEALGLERGRLLLEKESQGEGQKLIGGFLEGLASRGYTSLRGYFASQRYLRWISIAAKATMEARAGMVCELLATYGIEQEGGDSRIRFFRQTVFKGARDDLGNALERLMEQARAGMTEEELSQHIAMIRGNVQTTAEEDYFLARMAYRHLGPQDEASLVSMPSGDKRITELVVSLVDGMGNRFRVRGGMSAREVARLLSLFGEANLSVTFGQEHEYLLAVDDREQVIGGLYYRKISPERVHFEKIVVGRAHRMKGVSDGLLYEFMKRQRAKGILAIETGYFRPEYLFRFGFRPDSEHGGLRRDLVQEPIGRESRAPSMVEG